jgi:hypothetical protein
MKQLRPITVLMLAVLFVLSPLLHATHDHGPGQDADGDGVGSECVLCLAGPAFDVDGTDSATDVEIHQTSKLASTQSESFLPTFTASRVDSRAPPA